MKINLSQLSSKLQAYKNCIISNNTEWKDKHEDSINLMLENLPHGSGIDSGIKFDWDNSTSNKLIFDFDYHHMDEHGGYDGWTAHQLILTPSFAFGYNSRITGKNRNDIKTYLYDLFTEIFEIK